MAVSVSTNNVRGFPFLHILASICHLSLSFFFFWLRWVFVAVRGLSLVVASRGYSSLWCAGFSLRWLLLLRSTGSKCEDLSSCSTRAQCVDFCVWCEIGVQFNSFACVYLVFTAPFIYLFMAVLGLSSCERAFSSCGKRRPLFITVRGPLTVVASLVAEHRLQMRRLSNCGSQA